MAGDKTIRIFLRVTLACFLLVLLFGTFPNVAHAANFGVGDTVEVTTNLNVRTNPGTSYPEITDPDYHDYAPAGTRGQIISGPSSSDGYTWWQVDFGPGLYSGWSVEAGLEKVPSIVSASINSYSPSSLVEITVGGSTAISVTFTNTGDTPWNFIAGATVWDSGGNQVANYSQTLSSALQPGQQTTINWTHPVNQAGEYWLQFGIWKATPYTSENLLDKKPSPSQNLIRGVAPTNQLPTCSVTANPMSGNAPLAVTFSLSASDPDGSITAWVLDVNGDGNADYSGMGNPPSTISHTYNNPGGYSVVLMVSDNDEASTHDTEVVNVGSANNPPNCTLSANPNSGSAPLTVTFSISASDPDGSITTWVLDADGNGSTDYSGSGNPPSTQSHTYESPGNYTAVLMVSDNDDATASDTETVSVSQPSLPDLVVTDIQVDPSPLTAGGSTTISITIANQGGADATDTFFLEFYFDGTYQGHVSVDSLTAGSSRTSYWQAHTWPSDTNPHTIKGVVDPEDTVSESNESNNELSEQFTAEGNQAPICSLSANPDSGSAPLHVTFSLSASDPDGSINAWVLDVDGDGNADYSGTGTPPSTQSYTYDNTGAYSVILMVADNNGAEAFDTETVNVGENIPPTCALSATPTSGNAPLDVSFAISADDSDGSISAWALDVNGDGTNDYSGTGNPPSTQTHTYSTQGTYTVILMVSDDEDVTASDTAIINVDPSVSGPDLVISGMTWTPASPSIGDTVTFTVTIKNQGIVEVGSSKVYYFIDDIQKGYDYVSSLDPGASTTETFTWQAQAGIHAIKAIADYQNNVSESDEDNNEKIITFSSTALSDLIVESVTWSPLSPSIGDTVTFTITIKNQGSGEASSSKVYYFIDDIQKGYDYVSSLDPDASTTETFTWYAQDGQHIIRAVIDQNEEVIESNEANNEKAITYSATALADLVINEITWTPTNPSIGDSVTFTVTIKNQGTGEANGSSVYYFIDDIQQEYDYISSLEPSATTTETFTWDVPDGTHAIKAVVDYEGDVIESDETNNENTVMVGPPDILARIDSHSPAVPLEVEIGELVTLGVSFTNTGNVDWTFYGAASLRRPNGTEEHLQLKSISLTSGEQGNATWSYIIDAKGSWDIIFGIWEEQEQVNSLDNTGWLNNYIICSKDDTIAPQVDSLFVDPSSIVLDDSFTISYSVSDAGDSGLSRVELWRAYDSNGNPANWMEITRNSASGDSDSGSFTDIPTSVGFFWYGIHVIDTAGNWATEDSAVRVEVKLVSVTEEPFIDYIDPQYGASGENITIVGGNFKKEKTKLLDEYIKPNVIFGETSVSDLVSWTDQEIIIRVPEFYRGKKKVDVRLELYLNFGLSYKTSNTLQFTYKEPLLESVFPLTGSPGEDITLRGDYFGSEDQSGNYVKFGSTPLVSEIVSWNNEEIVVKAPDDYGMGLNPYKFWFDLILLSIGGAKAIDKPFEFAIDLLVSLIPDLKLVEWELTEDEPLFKQWGKKAAVIVTPAGVFTIKPSGEFEVPVTVKTSVGESQARTFTFNPLDLIDIEDSLIAHLASSGELRVYDSQGHVTGIVNGAIVEEIPSSFAVSSGVFIKEPKDTYRYEVVGTEQGTYGLDVASIEGDIITNFGITDISTSEQAVHRYTINWDALRKGEPSISVQIDADGDKTFEQAKIVEPPIASFIFSPISALTNESIDFDASDSIDVDGEIISYKWNFGDGNASTGKIVTHTYADPGEYIIVLAVIDNDGLLSTYSKAVQVEQGKGGLPIWIWVCIGLFVAIGCSFILWRYSFVKIGRNCKDNIIYILRIDKHNGSPGF